MTMSQLNRPIITEMLPVMTLQTVDSVFSTIPITCCDLRSSAMPWKSILLRI